MNNIFAKTLSLCLLIVVGFSTLASADEAKTFRIGVFAVQGDKNALERWVPTVQYLNERLENVAFELVPIDLSTITDSSGLATLDFALTSAAQGQHLVENFGASRLATLCHDHDQTTICQTGGVIFSRADNKSITSLSDLKGKSFIGVHNTAFGGYLIAKNELRNYGINSGTDFSELLFAGLPQDRVIYAIRDGIADAGTVETGVFEKLISEGKVEIDDYRILMAETAPSKDVFPFIVSTQTYPGLSFSSFSHIEQADAKMVVNALYAIEPSHTAAQLGHYSNWTVPIDHSQVRNFLSSTGAINAPSNAKQGQDDYRTVLMLALLLALFTIIEIRRYRANRTKHKLYEDAVGELEIERHHRKMAESASSRFGLIVEESKNEIFILGADSLNIQHVNKGACQHLGLDRESMIGAHFNRYIEGLCEDTLRKTIAPLILNPSQSKSVEVTMTPPNGAPYPAECHIQYMMDDGEPILVFTIHDLSERKKVERALMQNERSLENAQRIANLGHWDWDISGGNLHWSDQIYRIFGLTPREFEATYDAFLERVHPDDRDAVASAVNAALEKDGPKYNIRHRVIQPSGNLRYVEEQGEITRDGNGAPIWMTGIVIDITEKLQTEKRIKELGGSQ